MEIQDVITLIIIPLLGLFGAGAAYIIGRREKKISSDATAAASISEAYSGLVDDLRKRVAHLEDRCDENDEVMEENENLRKQVEKLEKEKEELSKKVAHLSMENEDLRLRLGIVVEKLRELQARVDKIDTNSG